MSIISDCEFCRWVSNTPNATYTKQTEFYDGIDGLENVQMCWRCGEAAKFEKERIIKLLEDKSMCSYEQSGFCYCEAIALIKGENK